MKGAGKEMREGEEKRERRGETERGKEEGETLPDSVSELSTSHRLECAVRAAPMTLCKTQNKGEQW